MGKLLKILAVLIILMVLALTFLFFWLDPNVFKSRIQAEAAKQGIHLGIEGDLHWQFWPSVGFEVNNISVASINTPTEVLATLKNASLLVAVRPLLKNELVVHHLLINGATANLTTTATGENNWEQLYKTGGHTGPRPNAPVTNISTESATETTSVQVAELSVESISITDSTVSLLDEKTQQKTVITLQALQISDVNLQEAPIQVNGEWGVALYEGNKKSLTLAIEANATLEVDAQLNALAIRAGLTLVVGDKTQETITGDLSLKVEDLQGSPSYTGEWSMLPINLKSLMASMNQAAPETTLEKALTHFSMKTHFKGTDKTLTLSPLTLVLDESTLKGSVAITDIERGALNVTLSGDTINVDHYLAPMPEGNTTPTATATTVKNAEPLIPLDVVNTLEVNAALEWSKAIVSGMTLNEIKTNLVAKKGVVTLKELSLNAYNGRFTSQATLTAKNKTALIHFTASMDNMDLAPLLQDLELDEDAQLSGAINVKLSGNTNGITEQVLMDQLVANATFNGAKVRFSPLNVEERFCQLVNLLDKGEDEGEGKLESTADVVWPEYTAMRELDGVINIKNQVVTIESFSAGVAHLQLTTLGEVNLADETYDMRLPFKLSEKSTSESGCTVKSNYWLDRSLSLLRCHGSLNSLDPLSDCGFDSSALKSLTADYATYRIQKELVKELGGKEDDQGNPSLESQAVELLFDLFKNKKKKKNKE